MYEKKIIVTDDGSHSIELIGQNEQYHSIHGAIQESQHVFINYGLKRIAEFKKDISCLEVGMGTGLNTLLSFVFSMENNLNINYLGLELYPIQEDIWKKLNYTYQLKLPELQTIFELIHSSNWETKLTLNNHFNFFKKEESIVDFDPERTFDLIYFDAFNPDLEPNLWKEDVFKKIYESMNSNSLLTTYSTKGVVKRALKSCGFKIEKHPGPPGKREILNAWKI